MVCLDCLSMPILGKWLRFPASLCCISVISNNWINTHSPILVQTVCRDRLAGEGVAKLLLLGLSYDTLRIGRVGLFVDSVQSDRSASPVGAGGVAVGNGLRIGWGENGSEAAGAMGRLCCPCWITLSFGP